MLTFLKLIFFIFWVNIFFCLAYSEQKTYKTFRFRSYNKKDMAFQKCYGQEQFDLSKFHVAIRRFANLHFLGKMHTGSQFPCKSKTV